jgi:two-component system sensor histidine kinase KdpD
MSNRDSIADYRVRVVKLGLVVSWASLAVFAVVGIRDRGIGHDLVFYPLVVLGGLLVALSAVPWRKVLRGRFGDAVIAVWCVAAVAGILAAGPFRSTEAAFAGFLAAIVFAGAALVRPPTLAVVAGATLAGYATSVIGGAEDAAVADLATPIAAFAVTSFLLWLAAGGIGNRLIEARDRLLALTRRETQLERREGELERLYDISRTIGSGSNLSEVLPELVGRVTHAVGARTGLVLLYRPKEEHLEVMSPIWVGGRTLPIEERRVPLAAAGLAQQVFTSGVPVVVNDLATDVDDALLAELDASKVAVVRLQIESRAIGVLMAADKALGDFDDADVALLESLAGPAALVLNQMARYEEARETGEKMAELARLKTDFVSVVSHELRTPLTSIIGSLKTLQRPELSPTDPNAVELLTTAERQAQRLRTLIEDLLVVSRLDNQALPVRPQLIGVEDFLLDAVGDIPGAPAIVRVTVSEGAEKLLVDPEHLRRIVRNLVENALKYAPGALVEIRAQRHGAEVWIAVADHGPGIPYELHQHIFDRFTQVDRHETRGTGGTGLGLSIVRGLTEAMGGRVWFEPTLGGGATFSIALRARAGTRTARAEP